MVRRFDPGDKPDRKYNRPKKGEPSGSVFRNGEYLEALPVCWEVPEAGHSIDDNDFIYQSCGGGRRVTRTASRRDE